MTIKYLKSTDRGAGVLTGARGSALAILDSALVSGFPSSAALSASVTSEVLTVVESGSKRRAGQTVHISSPSTPALDREYTVATADATGFVCTAVTGLANASVSDAIASGEVFVGTPTSITRSGATVTVNMTAHGFTAGQRARIAGAAQGDYNGYWEVATVADADNFTYTLPTALTPATPATGTILVSYGSAGLGWTKKYSTTNKTVYEQGASGGAAQNAVLVANEADTGTNPYAIALMMAEGATSATAYTNACYVPEGADYGGIFKSTTTDATARPWKVIGDHRTGIFFTKPGCAGTGMNATGWQHAYFGDVAYDVPSAAWPQGIFLPLRHSSYPHSNNANAQAIYSAQTSYSTNHWVKSTCAVTLAPSWSEGYMPRMLRGYGQSAGRCGAGLHSPSAMFTNSVSSLNVDQPLGDNNSVSPYDAYPSPVTGGLLYGPIAVGAYQTGQNTGDYRKVGKLRGLEAPLHRAIAGWVDGDTFNVAGAGSRKFEVVFLNGRTGSWMLLDTSENWS
jgi:hypothetical protein